MGSGAPERNIIAGPLIPPAAKTTVVAFTVSFTPVGLALASADIKAESTAIGMQGGEGHDFIQNTETGILELPGETAFPNRKPQGDPRATTPRCGTPPRKTATHGRNVKKPSAAGRKVGSMREACLPVQ